MKRKTGYAAPILSVLLAAGAAFAAPPAPSSGWLADGDAIDSFGSVNGTAGGSLSYVAGVFDQAFSFDGSGSVGLAQDAFRSFATSDTTIVAWIKTNTGGDTAAVKFQDQWLLYFDSAQPGVITGVWEDWPSRLSSGVNVRDGQWHHVASVYAGGTASIYVDGILRASGARGRFAGCDTCGSNAFGSGYFANYVGLLDDVGIYKYALTEQQISSVMTEGLAAAVPEPGTWALFLGGLVAVGIGARRSSRNA